MAVILTYLLKANVVLALFALAYYGLLRRLTFFTLNRAYLLLALLFAAAYPMLPVPALLPAGAGLPAALVVPAGRVAGAAAASPGFDWQAAGLLLYAVGAGLLLLRLLGQLGSLALVRARSRPAVALGQLVRVLPGGSGPFSFGRTIYLSEAALADAAGLPAALRHEQAHVRQCHTLDVLLTQLATALAWANPAAWLLRRAVLDNLEYLADRAALRTGLDRRAYQYSLLRQQPGGVPAPALAFHFSFLTLKNRILMLNQPDSTTRQLGRYLLAAPLLMALALGYSGARAQVAPPSSLTSRTFKATAITATDAFVYIDGYRRSMNDFKALDSNDFASINVVNGLEALAYEPDFSGPGILFVTTKQNQKRPDVVAFNAKQHLAQKAAELPADATYFLNGKASTRQEITTLNPATIYRTDVLQGAQAAAMAHDENTKLVVVVQTK